MLVLLPLPVDRVEGAKQRPAPVRLVAVQAVPLGRIVEGHTIGPVGIMAFVVGLSPLELLQATGQPVVLLGDHRPEFGLQAQELG